MILTNDDARVHLNLSDTPSEAVLTGYIAAAVAYVEERVGPLEPKTVVEQVTYTGGSLILSTTPLVSITSITTAPSAVVNVNGVVLSPAGVVTWLNGNPLNAGDQLTVTYVAGRSAVPADLLLAVKETLRHLYRAQRSGTQRSGSKQPEQTPGPSAIKLVDDLLKPYRVFGFA